MPEMLPTVSVVIPTYNYAQYISEAVNSILSQSYAGKIEIIVVDDGSADNTKAVLQPFIDHGDLQYYYQQNKGKANATSFGVQKSLGKYIFNLDADDYFLPGKIATVVGIFESDDSIVHVASPAQIFLQENAETTIEKLPADITGKTLDGNWLLKRFYNHNILFGGGSTYSARASVLKAIHIPDNVDMYIDEFLILALLPFGKSYFVPEPLSVWRVHNANYSGSSTEKEKKKLKGERLLKSSSAVLSYMQQNNFGRDLITLYRLQDATRRIALKENLGTKKIADIFNYCKEVFFSIKPQAKLLGKYNVINRLIPSDLFRLLKKVRATFQMKHSAVK